MEVLKKPIITEKQTDQQETFNRYGFVVERKANKLQIKKAVEDMYGVTVERVNTMNYKGEENVRFTKSGVLQGRTKSFKKAVVTLADGESIDFFSNL